MAKLMLIKAIKNIRLPTPALAESPAIWAIMIGTGCAFGFGHFLLIKGFEVAPASVIAPFIYSQMIWVTIFGFILFGHFPDYITILGVVIVVSSGIYIWYRETRAARPHR